MALSRTERSIYPLEKVGIEALVKQPVLRQNLP